ncbi:MAG: carbon storage regulator [Polyangiaceae bacterium]
MGKTFEIVVTEVTRGSVKLGIVAPSRTAILRGELHDAVEDANQAAVQTVSDPTELALPLPAGAGPWGKRP